MTSHKDRATIRAEYTDPVNFTCGKCMKVVPFEDGYKCPYCDVEEKVEEAQ